MACATSSASSAVTAGFGRLRLGVGHPGDKAKVTGYLLSRPPAAERAALESAIEESLRVLPELVDAADWQRASTELHTRTKAGD
jgi:PTH1 family peptidyl-tRNA hydrolase